MWITERYEQVKESARIAGKCSICGKTVVKSKTFMATVNPFNKNSEGTVKNYTEVRQDVINKVTAWEKSEIDFTHQKCKEIK